MAAPAPVEVRFTLADELRHATAAHRDAQEVARRCSKRWKAAVVAAIDAGMSHNAVAQLAGISRARIHHILLEDAGS